MEYNMLNISDRNYIGNKSNFIDSIKEIIEENCSDSFEYFIDLFGGLGVVADSFNTPNQKIIVNDFLYSNYITYETWLGTTRYNKEKIEKYISEFNNIDPNELEENYFSENYGNTFFSLENAKKIGYIRDMIDELFSLNEINTVEKNILITSLIYATDKVANIYKHYESFNKKLIKKNLLELKIPNIKTNNNTDNLVFNCEANKLIKNLKKELVNSIVYIDPPYTSRQYGYMYHLLENIALWEKPTLKGKSKKPFNLSKLKSIYSTNKALDNFKELISSLRCKYILVSFTENNSKSERSKSKISKQDIEMILKEKGIVKKFDISTNVKNKEFIFLCELYTSKKSTIDYDELDKSIRCECKTFGYFPLNYEFPIPNQRNLLNVIVSVKKYFSTTKVLNILGLDNSLGLDFDSILTFKNTTSILLLFSYSSNQFYLFFNFIKNNDINTILSHIFKVIEIHIESNRTLKELKYIAKIIKEKYNIDLNTNIEPDKDILPIILNSFLDTAKNRCLLFYFYFKSSVLSDKASDNTKPEDSHFNFKHAPHILSIKIIYTFIVKTILYKEKLSEIITTEFPSRGNVYSFLDEFNLNREPSSIFYINLNYYFKTVPNYEEYLISFILTVAPKHPVVLFFTTDSTYNLIIDFINELKAKEEIEVVENPIVNISHKLRFFEQKLNSHHIEETYILIFK